MPSSVTYPEVAEIGSTVRLAELVSTIGDRDAAVVISTVRSAVAVSTIGDMVRTDVGSTVRTLLFMTSATVAMTGA